MRDLSSLPPGFIIEHGTAAVPGETPPLEVLASVIESIEDKDAFAAFSQDIRTHILIRLAWLHRIKAAAKGDKIQVTRQAAGALGVNATTIDRMAVRFRREGWRCLIDRRRGARL